MREIRLSSSMSGMWKRSMAWLMRHRQTKGPGTDRPDLNHRATSRLYTRKKKMMQYNGLGIQQSAYGTTSMFSVGLDDEFLDPSRGRGHLENIIDLP
jgi:hypothetical protein